MSVARNRPKGWRYYAPFGLSVLVMSIAPRQIGHQDLVALMARQGEAAQRVRAHMLASPFGTIHAATLSLPQPLGTLIPEPPVRLASIGSDDPDVTGSIGRDLSGGPMLIRRLPLEFPTVNRRLKGDLLITRPRDVEPPNDGTRDLTPGRIKTVSFPRPDEPLSVDEANDSAPGAPAAPSVAPARQARPPQSALFDPIDDSNAAVRLGRLYFGNNPLGQAMGTIEPWPADEEVVIVAPAMRDADIKRSALPPTGIDFNFETAGAAAAQSNVADIPSSGETVAPKGEVTGLGKRPRTPAERLGLSGKLRAKAEKCLAEAVYFESRGEPKRGQIAVAQVVMNRVFSGFYPTDVCGVVYQNANRKLACQFTFACDGIPDVVNEPDMWEQAKEIARDMMDGKLWLPEIGHSTHYHAYWVHPSWVNEMKKLYKIGVHSFYRPRNWGDGSEVPPLNQSQVQAPAAEGEPRQAKL